MDRYFNAQEISEMLHISEGSAYKLIRQLNKEMAAMGYIVFTGRVNANYFMERVCYKRDEGKPHASIS